jgi:hypothetical protein
MIPTVTLRKALSDPNLLGNTLAGDSWKAWRVLLIAAVGEELTDDERVIFKQLTGREREPGEMCEEFVGVISRRGGKSRAISVLVSWIGGLCQHPSLVRGERGVLLIISQDQRQANIVLDYIEANFAASPILSQLVESRIQRTIRLTNGIMIEVRAADFRSLRGPSYIGCVGDECAFWMTGDSANPDSEILNAVRPGLATTGGPLVLISSPYARRGELWNAYDRHFGAKGDPKILVAQASSRAMNATLPQSVVDRAMERDPSSAAAEFGAEFRRDIENFVSVEAVRACVSAGVFERGPLRNIAYIAACDPSGGSIDAMTLCVGHMEHARETVVIDALREVRPPFSPEATVAEFCALLKSYHVSKVTGDRYAGEWPREQFGKCGVLYEPAAKPKSDLYLDLLPSINSRRVDLLDHPKTINQLVGLERRTARGGKDSIDHAPGAHDDLANVVAGVASICITKGTYNLAALADTLPDDPHGIEGWRRMRLANYLYSGGLIG